MQPLGDLSITLVERRHVDLGRVASAIAAPETAAPPEPPPGLRPGLRHACTHSPSSLFRPLRAGAPDCGPRPAGKSRPLPRAPSSDRCPRPSQEPP
ncbi:putative leader peptide [Streptomyces anulatus]|uniref:putative leader peptide n=1 Tax=Streptomyces anulatus TaxID=1892 RepID=UPI00386F143C